MRNVAAASSFKPFGCLMIDYTTGAATNWKASCILLHRDGQS